MGCNCKNKKRNLRSSAAKKATDYRKSQHKRLLLHFYHGLGDAALFRYVLASIKQQRPNWEIDVITKYGKHSLLEGMCRNVFLNPDHAQKDYHLQQRLPWLEGKKCSIEHVANKATRCLQEIFNLEPILPRCPLTIPTNTHVDKWIDEHIWAPFVVFHYKGNTARQNKNLTDGEAQEIVSAIRAAGWQVVLLDWDNRCKVEGALCPGEQSELWRNKGTGDGLDIATLIDRANLFIGIDSGPTYVATHTDTPTLAIFKGHHPVHYMPDLKTCPNVKVFCPGDVQKYARSDKPDCSTYLVNNYNVKHYKNLTQTLLRTIEDTLNNSGNVTS